MYVGRAKQFTDKWSSPPSTCSWKCDCMDLYVNQLHVSVGGAESPAAESADPREELKRFDIN